MDEIVLGVDAGSTAIKVVAVDTVTGAMVASESVPTPRTMPAPGRIDIDVIGVADAAGALLRALPAPVRAATRAVGVTGQMCTPVLVRADGRPVAPAQSIFDNRCGAETAALADFAEHLLEHEGNRALSIHTLPKLMWTAAHRPAELDAARRVVCVKDFVRADLTGEWGTDPSDASGTAVFDQRADRWDTAVTDRCDLPAHLFGEVRASDVVAGEITAAVAARTGLAPGVPVVTGAADMAAVAAGVGSHAGDVVVSVGTAGQVIAPASDLSADVWPVQQYRSAGADRHYRFGAVFSVGLAFDWLFDLFGTSWSDAPLCEPGLRPAGAADPATVPLFMPYLAGAGAPHYRPEAAGAFTGLRVGHGRADLAAAVLDGVAIEIAAILDVVAPTAAGRIVLTGGASRCAPLVTAVAAATGRVVERTQWTEAAGVGAAHLAATGLAGRSADVPVPTTRCAATTEQIDYLAAVRARYDVAATAVRAVPSGSDSPLGTEN